MRNANQSVNPPNMLSGDIDVLSESVHRFSKNLTKLLLRATQLSSALFWPPSGSPQRPQWPNLRHFKVLTTIETAQGGYALLPADKSQPHVRISTELDGMNLNPGHQPEDPDRQKEWEVGLWPEHEIRQRPDPIFFDNLAISIAQAASNMPKLERMMYSTVEDGISISLGHYVFSFFSAAKNGEPPRIDWVFGCNEAQLLGWKIPCEASRLWKDKCVGNLVESIITYECRSAVGNQILRRIDGAPSEVKVWFKQHFEGHEEDWMD